MADAEAFICQLYNHGTEGVDINEERAAEFPKVKKNHSLPRTKDTLHLHIYGMRTSSACLGKKAKEPRPSLSSPEENGWF